MADKRLKDLENDAAEITGILSENVNKVIEREGKLADLDVRGQELVDMSKVFHKTARTVERKTRWSNIKFKIIIAAAVTLFILILILVLYFSLAGGSQEGSNPPPERSSNAVSENSGNTNPPGQ
ncbi:vesicle-associated membrane protein 5 [Ambystoma mexicanum]|uniref:vesicle-associated membrane protein 5 n=1 Tax=Ambystoma mexicanum TaxID=8296 RepID=UPI0037E7DADB